MERSIVTSVSYTHLDVLNQKIDGLATKAMRVLAFGYSEKELVENTINDDVVIIGLVGIRDDVRPEAKVPYLTHPLTILHLLRSQRLSLNGHR